MDLNFCLKVSYLYVVCCVVFTFFQRMNDLDKLFSPSQWSTRFTPEEVIGNHVEYVTKVSRANEESIPCQLNVAYGIGEEEKINIFGTDLPGDAPIFVYVHGGYWQELSREMSGYPARPLYDQGIKVITVGYDLCPEVTLQEICDEINKALIFCLNYTKKLESRKLTICGHSAGAHLILQFVLDKFQELPEEDKAISKHFILISGIYDLTPLINTYVNKPLNLDYTSAHKLSPMFQNVNCKQTKFWIFVGENDSPAFKSQAVKFYSKLQDGGSQAELSVLQGRDHFDIVERLNCSDFEIVETVINTLK